MASEVGGKLRHVFRIREDLARLSDFAVLGWTIGDVLEALEDVKERTKLSFGLESGMGAEIENLFNLLEKKYDQLGEHLSQEDAEKLNFYANKWKNSIQRVLDEYPANEKGAT